MKTFGELCFYAIAVIAEIFINSFVLMTMWSWFIVHTFRADRISMVDSAGIVMLPSFIGSGKKDDEDEELTPHSVSKKFFVSTIKKFMILSLAWSVTFMQ